MSHEDGDWVREGTPRDADAEWNDEQSEYGTALSPAEWDDYSSEQSVPVEPPHVPPAASTDELPLGDAAPARAADVAPEDFVETTYDEPDAFAAPEPEHAGTPETADDVITPGVRAEDPADEHVATPGVPVDGGAEDRVATPGIPVPGHDETRSTSPGGPSEPVDLSDEVGVPGTAVVDEVVGEDTAPVDLTDPAGPVPPVAALEETDPGLAHAETADLAPGALPEEDVVVETSTAEETTIQEVDDEPDYEEDLSDEYVNGGAEDLPEDPDATRVAPAFVPEPAVDEETVAVEETTEVVGDEPTEVVEDLEATRAVPVVATGAATGAMAAGGAGAAAVAAGAASIPDDVYRTGETAVITDQTYPRSGWDDEAEAEERRLNEQLEAERRARDERLGVVPTSSENELRADAGPAKVTTDKFLPSFGLFVLRLVTAAILAVGGYQILTALDDTVEFISRTAIPEPRLVTWVLGFTLGGLALFLIIGMLQRVVGFILLALSVCSLVFIRWGAFNPFIEGQEGFLGDKDLLLAAIGLLLLCLGGGLWGVDGAFRRARARAKAEKQG